MADAAPAIPGRRDWSWRSRALRGLLYQTAAVALLALLLWFLAGNTVENMRVRGIQSGFGFLSQPAGFDIGESVFAFDSSHSYGQAFLVGLTNTVRVAAVGILFTTLLGTLIGIGRLSRNFLVSRICGAYVELFRNVPVLLQLLMWYFTLTGLLPSVANAWRPIEGVFLSQSGLQFPIPVWGAGQLYAAIGFFLGCAAAWLYRRRAIRHFENTGKARPLFWPVTAMVVLSPFLGWAIGGAPTAMDVPEMGPFNVSGGGALTPEYLALLIGLTLYTSAFVAEIVRGGVLAVPSGQTEAAGALGLTRARTMRLVLLPQALRVIIPPLTSQYLNITKNSSLAVAVGYPDLVSISTTTLNQTGRAVECIAIIMAVYLTLSLLTAALMNWYNSKATIKER